MANDLRISADELRRRMQVGGEFAIIAVRNPHASREATDTASGAIRAALADADRAIGRIFRNRPILTYCT